MYLLAQDTLNGAEGKITVTRDGRITEICGMKNIKTVAGIQTSDMKTIGTRTVQKKANGVTQTGTGNVYFGSNGSNLFTDMLLQYINTGVMETFDITITNNDPTASVGDQVMGYYGCMLTGEIPLSIAISRDAEISLNLSAEMQSLQLFVEERIQEHDLSPESHKDLRIAAAKMQADIDILQLKIATDVTANPFSVTFESLDGLTVTGVWNADLSRIEF